MCAVCVTQCHLEARKIMSTCMLSKPWFHASNSISNLIVSFTAAESVVAWSARCPEPYCGCVCGVCQVIFRTTPCGVLVKRHRASIECSTHNRGYIAFQTLPLCVFCVSCNFTSKAVRGVCQATPCGAAWRCFPSTILVSSVFVEESRAVCFLERQNPCGGM